MNENLIKIKDLYICYQYPAVEGDYLGTPYKFKDVVLRQRTFDDTTGQKFAARIKGAHLDRFLAEGLDKANGTTHTFHLIFDCQEKFRKDGTKYPQNSTPVIVGWE